MQQHTHSLPGPIVASVIAYDRNVVQKLNGQGTKVELFEA